MSQTTPYVLTSAIGQAGQIADSSDRTIDSFAAEATTIPFGFPVQRGTIPAKQVKKFAGGTFAGIAVFSHVQTTGEYPIKSAVSVMSKGRVIVDTLAVSVVAGTVAYAVDATGVITNVGTDATAIGKFLTTGTGLQVLQLID